MRIAVIEHRLQGSQSADARSLAEESRHATDTGAEVVFLPPVLPDGGAFSDAGQAAIVAERLGPTAYLCGDACIDPDELADIASLKPSVLVLAPGSENELQAEALLELAVALSESVAGLVVVAESCGAPDGEPGHGGSAIVLLGEVVAEALDGDEVLLADVPEPVSAPDAPEPLPVIPVILQQRLENHEGRKLGVSYPADLS